MATPAPVNLAWPCCSSAAACPSPAGVPSNSRRRHRQSRLISGSQQQQPTAMDESRRQSFQPLTNSSAGIPISHHHRIDCQQQMAKTTAAFVDDVPPLAKRHGRHPRLFAPAASLLYLLLLTMASQWPSARARPADPPVQFPSVRVPVGGIFNDVRTAETAEATQTLPGWLKLAQDGRGLFGVPQLRDTGKHVIQLKGNPKFELEVAEDQQSACGPERTTIWLEIVDPRKLDQLSVEEQFKAALSLLDNLKDVGVGRNELRLFPRSYLNRYRTVTETIHELDDDEESPKADEQMVFLLNISCGELTEHATEIINAVAENGLPFQVVQGTLVKAQQSQQIAAHRPQPPAGSGDSQLKADEEKEKKKADSSSSTLLVTFILVVILLAVVAALALYWLRNKQAEKRQKQANAETSNGKGSARPSGLDANAKASALSPASNDTATTPMLAADQNEEAQGSAKGPAGAKKS